MKRILILVLALALIMSVFTAVTTVTVSAAINKTQKELKLWYSSPAPRSAEEVSKGEDDYRTFYSIVDPNDGWMCWSMPMGNGYMGANVFGRTDTERLQISEPSLFAGADGVSVGFANFSETYIDFGHTGVTNYSRDLLLNDAIAHVTYTSGGVNYQREIFTSYPDKVMAIRLTANQTGKISFTLRPTIPHLNNPTVPTGNRKSGCSVVASGDTITLGGHMDYYGIDFEGQYKVIPVGGTMTASNPAGGLTGQIQVTGADEAVILVAVGTNYEFKSSVFTNGNMNQKLLGNAHPHAKVSTIISNASAKPYATLKANHLTDYKNYFERVNIDIGATVPGVTTDALLTSYKNGSASAGNQRYLEELYFQYGRYLAIASSREGSLPNNLQGIWNRYEKPPWTSGLWHNINEQMNYWATFTPNLTDMYKPYKAYSEAYMASARGGADNYLNALGYGTGGPAGTNGWTIGTGCWPYQIEWPWPNNSQHSGPGTGAFVAQMFWDYYNFTKDPTVLSSYTWPALSEMSIFYSRAVTAHDGKLLIEYSFSPEQGIKGWGCAYDQQMIYDHYVNTQRAAAASGNTSAAILTTINSQIDKLDPVIVGDSGQIKEYREETTYGSIGDPKHRHITQLSGLHPGTVINSSTPAWIDASKVTLIGREGGDQTGWATAWEQIFWARVKDGNHAHLRYQFLLKNFVLTNLWGMHPPAVFQIDANFGGTAGVAEMLLQSQDGFIEPMAAVPDAWTAASGSFHGLLARGNFEVSADWAAGGQANTFEIKSNKGGECSVKFYNIENAVITPTPSGTVTKSKDMITFNTTAGTTYTIGSIPPVAKMTTDPASFTAAQTPSTNKIVMNWSSVSGAAGYNIYKALESEPGYTLIASNVPALTHTYSAPPGDLGKWNTYKVVAVNADGRESPGLTKRLLLQMVAFVDPTITVRINEPTGTPEPKIDIYELPFTTANDNNYTVGTAGNGTTVTNGGPVRFNFKNTETVTIVGKAGTGLPGRFPANFVTGHTYTFETKVTATQGVTNTVRLTSPFNYPTAAAQALTNNTAYTLTSTGFSGNGAAFAFTFSYSGAKTGPNDAIHNIEYIKVTDSYTETPVIPAKGKVFDGSTQLNNNENLTFDTDTRMLTFVPDTGYMAVVTVDGTPVGLDNNTLTLQNEYQDIDVYVDFVEACTITTSVPGGHGTIECDANGSGGTYYAIAGQDVNVNFIPEEGYELTSVTINGSPQTPPQNFTIMDVSDDYDIVAVFTFISTYTKIIIENTPVVSGSLATFYGKLIEGNSSDPLTRFGFEVVNNPVTGTAISENMHLEQQKAPGGQFGIELELTGDALSQSSFWVRLFFTCGSGGREYNQDDWVKIDM